MNGARDEHRQTEGQVRSEVKDKRWGYRAMSDEWVDGWRERK